jgi:two-component system sensor histidine kinase TctE
MLTEMVKNLVDNAIRYTPDGGTITVRVQDSESTGGVALEVEDTGIGITESERPMVFDRFYRVLGTQVDGSGLGLSIVKETAQQHGASVTIQPNPKSKKPGLPGSVFRVSFPPAHIQIES